MKRLSIAASWFFAIHVCAASVGSNGLPTVDYKITLSPAINSLQPEITLRYSSGPPDVLGPGWSLNASSEIYRCNAIRAADQKLKRVTNTVNDKLCLDGKRLIPLDSNGAASVVGPQTGDATGQAAGAYREFRTENDEYLRIRAYGYPAASTVSAGPLYFRVWTKNGRIVDYGNSPNTDANSQATVTAAYPIDSPVQYAKAWMISHSVDAFGNYIDYRYNQRSVNWGSNASSQAGREWTLSEIDYSGNKIILSYTDRATGFPVQDGSESYATVDKTVTLRRLDSIVSYVNAPYSGVLGVPAGALAVSTTKFGYTASPSTQRSLLTSIQTCAGGPSSTTCAPAETFKYTNGGGDQVYKELVTNIGTAPLYTKPPAPPDPGTWPGFGDTGLITGDFNGDGRTDFIRWSGTDPSQNQLYLSNGDGSFTVSSGFNIKDQLLFRHDGCVQSSAQDFDNDGLLDILVYSSPSSWMSGTSSQPGFSYCSAAGPTTGSVIYHNNGDGTFTRQAVNITQTDGTPIPLKQVTYDNIQYILDFTTGIRGTRWDEGHVYYFVDIDGDGILDLITSIRPQRPSGTANNVPTTCPGVCTHVFKGNGHGDFAERPTNIAGAILYSDGTGRLSLAHNIYDTNNDGYPDINTGDAFAYGGQCVLCSFLSRGDFNFDVYDRIRQYITGVMPSSGQFVDYNGDGRIDSRVGNVLLNQDQVSGLYKSVSTFNLNQFSQWISPGPVQSDFVVVDLNGDGRQDFMRVNTYIPEQKYNTTSSIAYVSNGDSTFTQSTTYNVDALLAADGFTTSSPANSWVLGDFTGHGQPEILALSPTKNVLYVRANQAPTDLLYQTTDSMGATTTFDYVALGNSLLPGESVPRYVTDRLTANAASGNNADVDAGGFVVSTMLADNGIGGTINTDFWYTGLKRDLQGRGSLGFREVRRQHAAADGSTVTDQTIYAQGFPYTGEPLQTNQFHASANAIASANQLSAIRNIYCDQTAAAGTDTAAISSGVSCTSSAVSKRPYTLWTQTQAWDLTGAPLPTKTRQSSINADGAPTTTSETATVPGTTGMFTQTTTNQYPASDDTSCTDIYTCRWILARVQRTTVTSSVPSAMLSTAAGSAPLATATSGNANFGLLTSTDFGAVTVGTSPAPTRAATLTNQGEIALSFTVPSAASVSGADFSFSSTTCSGTLQYLQTCTITVKFAPTAATARSGTLTVSTTRGAVTGALTGTGATPTATLTPQRANWGTVGIASDSGDWPTVTNTSTVPILITGHSVASGPAGAWSYQGTTGKCIVGTTVLQPSTSCQTFFGMGQSTAVGAFSATDQISYQAVGVTGSTFTVQQPYTWSTATATATAASLTFPNTAVNTTSASQTFTVKNNATGSPVNIAVSMIGAQPANFPMSNTCGGNLAAGASCTVTVSFNPTSVASGVSASVQVATTYPRIANGSVEAYYYAAPAIAVPATGNGTGAVATRTSAATLTSPATWYSDVAPTVTATYRNDGNVPMTLASPALTAPLSVTSNGCTSIAVGASCNMVVTVATNVAGISVNQSFTPSGAAVAPAATTINWTTKTAVPSWSPASLSFGNVVAGTSATQNITLTNQGNTAYNWAVKNTFANAPAGYSFDTSACTNVTPGGTCNVVVTFAPTAIGTTYSGSGIALSSISYNANTFAVSGTGSGSSATRTSAATLSTPAVWYGAAAQTVTATYRNDGNLPMTLATPALAAPLSVTSNNCSAIAAGASCSMVVTAATNVPGIAMSQSFTPTGANVAPAATAVTWQTQTAVPHWNPTSLSFGTVPVGTSPTQSITLINDGNVAYNWVANSAIANPPAGYSINTSACSNVAANGGSCNVIVTFSPASGIGYSGSGISMSAASYNTNTFSVSGTGGLPVLSVSPTSLTLPNTQVGSSNVSSTVTVTNTGNYVANSLGLSAAAPFSVVSSTCGTSLAAGANCTFAAQYAPSAAGTNTGNISVSAQYASSAHISLSGQAANAAGTLSAVAFGNVPYGSSATASATLTNTGIGALSVPAVTNGMVQGAGFSLVSTTCPASLASGANCTIAVRFTPVGVQGSSGNLEVPTGAGSLITTLSGTGVQATTVASIASGSLAFGTKSQNSGSPTLSITVSNGGNSAMTLTGLSGLTTPFSLTGNTCSGIAPGGTCVMTVTMSTSSPGTWSQSLTSVGATSNFGTTTSGSVPGAVENGPWANGATLSFCSGQFATIQNSYSFTISGVAETATLSPATSSLFTITYPTSGSSAWTNGATLNPGTYGFTIRAPSPPSGQVPLTMTFGSGHVLSATVNVYTKATCP